MASSSSSDSAESCRVPSIEARLLFSILIRLAVASYGYLNLKRRVLKYLKTGFLSLVHNYSSGFSYPHGRFLIGGEIKRLNGHGLWLKFFYNCVNFFSNQTQSFTEIKFCAILKTLRKNHAIFLKNRYSNAFISRINGNDFHK